MANPDNVGARAESASEASAGAPAESTSTPAAFAEGQTYRVTQAPDRYMRVEQGYAVFYDPASGRPLTGVGWILNPRDSQALADGTFTAFTPDNVSVSAPKPELGPINPPPTGNAFAHSLIAIGGGVVLHPAPADTTLPDPDSPQANGGDGYPGGEDQRAYDEMEIGLDEAACVTGNGPRYFRGERGLFMSDSGTTPYYIAVIGNDLEIRSIGGATLATEDATQHDIELNVKDGFWVEFDPESPEDWDKVIVGEGKDQKLAVQGLGNDVSIPDNTDEFFENEAFAIAATRRVHRDALNVINGIEGTDHPLAGAVELLRDLADPKDPLVRKGLGLPELGAQAPQDDDGPDSWDTTHAHSEADDPFAGVPVVISFRAAPGVHPMRDEVTGVNYHIDLLENGIARWHGDNGTFIPLDTDRPYPTGDEIGQDLYLQTRELNRLSNQGMVVAFDDSNGTVYDTSSVKGFKLDWQRPKLSLIVNPIEEPVEA
jgi:hypothetical protein